MTTIMSKDEPAIAQLAGLTIQEKLASVTEPGDRAVLVILHDGSPEYAATDHGNNDSTARKIAEDWRLDAVARKEAQKAAAARADEDARTARLRAETLADQAAQAARAAEQAAKRAAALNNNANGETS